MTKVVGPQLPETGRIIYFDSYAGQIPMPISERKHGGTCGLLQKMAKNWSEHVRCVFVSPFRISYSLAFDSAITIEIAG